MAPQSVGQSAHEGAYVGTSGPGCGSPGPTGLENYADSAPPPLSGPRARRYGRRALLWRESSLERVRKCGRVRRADLVGVRTGATGAGFWGLCSCGSPWSCPVCNAKIMARRSLELGLGIAAWQGGGTTPPGAVLFSTFTLSHHAGQSLAELWDGLLAAWRSMTKGKAWSTRRETLGLRGWVRVVEVTHGRNGWHVHLHCLFFVAGSVTADVADDFGGWAAARWSRAVVRQGLAAPRAVGQHTRLVRGPADADLAAYLAKATDLGLEMTASQSKRARSAHSTRPAWDLLSDVVDLGDADALALWHQWERGSLNRRQMTWSKGLRRELLGQAQEQTDEEIAAEAAGDTDLVLITADGWDVVVASPDLQPRILAAAETSPADLRRLLIRHGVAFLDPESTR